MHEPVAEQLNKTQTLPIPQIELTDKNEDTIPGVPRDYYSD